MFLNAEEVTKSALKEKANSLANYSVCESLGNKNDDPVMAFYYAGMLQDGLIENEKYTLNEQEYIRSERQNAVMILNKINSASMNQLCQSRFDPVSRQHYKSKWNNAEKTKK